MRRNTSDTDVRRGSAVVCIVLVGALQGLIYSIARYYAFKGKARPKRLANQKIINAVAAAIFSKDAKTNKKSKKSKNKVKRGKKKDKEEGEDGT